MSKLAIISAQIICVCSLYVDHLFGCNNVKLRRSTDQLRELAPDLFFIGARFKKHLDTN